MTVSRVPPGRTTVLQYEGVATVGRFPTAVSLHAHTNQSREMLRDIPRYLDRIPVIAKLVERELRGYEERNGEQVDFRKAWWTPPLSAEAVLHSEASQIKETLGLQSFVSITDHDNIRGPLALHGHPRAAVPISVEWTVPYGEGFFHLGVHNLDADIAVNYEKLLSAHTWAPEETSLSDLLEMLCEDGETLVVLNHPLWDLAGVGAAHHVRLLRRFLTEHIRHIHALELNGYRSLRENNGVELLAEACSLPLVSGGDRHGCAPNAMLNLTTALCFGDFVGELREFRQSVILIMPEYRQDLVSRKLSAAGDAMRSFPCHPVGQQRWTDRVCSEQDGEAQSLADSWPEGGPPWVRLATRAFQVGTSRPLLPLMRLLVWLAGASNSHRVGPATVLEEGLDKSPVPLGPRGLVNGSQERESTQPRWMA